MLIVSLNESSQGQEKISCEILYRAEGNAAIASTYEKKSSHPMQLQAKLQIS